MNAKRKPDPISMKVAGVKSDDEVLEPSGDVELLNEYNIQSKEADMIFEYLLSTKANKYLDVLYHGRGVGKLTGFRQSLRQCLDLGGYVINSNPRSPRTGNDEIISHPMNRRIRALCGYDNTDRIIDLARNARITNADALKQLVDSAIERMTL